MRRWGRRVGRLEENQKAAPTVSARLDREDPKIDLPNTVLVAHTKNLEAAAGIRRAGNTFWTPDGAGSDFAACATK